MTYLLCVHNLAGATWDLGDMNELYNIADWVDQLSPDEIIKVRFSHIQHQRLRVAHKVIAGPVYRYTSIVRWFKVIVKLRLGRKERSLVNRPFLYRIRREKAVPIIGVFMASMDKIFGPVFAWHEATIHSQRCVFATARVRSGIHMAYITLAIPHLQEVVMQYIGVAEKASITGRLPRCW